MLYYGRVQAQYRYGQTGNIEIHGTVPVPACVYLARYRVSSIGRIERSLGVQPAAGCLAGGWLVVRRPKVKEQGELAAPTLRWQRRQLHGSCRAHFCGET